jgi:integrase
VDDDKVWRRFKPFREVNAAKERFLSLDECQRLINAADRETGFRDLVRAALYTGMRYGELCRLTVGDFADGKLAVRKSKSGKPRYVRLGKEGTNFFSRLVTGRSPKEPMFMHYRLGRAWKKSDQNRPMREAVSGALLEPLSFHALRHTYASLAIMNGASLLIVSRNLGHTDTRMVEKHYGHLAASYEDEMIRNAETKFGIGDKTTVVPLR